jgi:predicted HD phosphohydrolase
LLHDIADGLAPLNHDRAAAEILRPYVRPEVCWTIEHHGLFQTYYYGHHYGWDRHARDQFKTNPHNQACLDFCERWDQASFDDGYNSEPLETFAPILEKVFANSGYKIL